MGRDSSSDVASPTSGTSPVSGKASKRVPITVLLVVRYKYDASGSTQPGS